MDKIQAMKIEYESHRMLPSMTQAKPDYGIVAERLVGEEAE